VSTKKGYKASRLKSAASTHRVCRRATRKAKSYLQPIIETMPKRNLDTLEPLPVHNFQSNPGPSTWTKRPKTEDKADQDSDSDDDEIQNNTDVYDEAILAVSEGVNNFFELTRCHQTTSCIWPLRVKHDLTPVFS
jgi:hypothetical protein